MVTDIGFGRNAPTTFVSFPTRGGERKAFFTRWWMGTTKTDDELVKEAWIGISHETLHFVLTDLVDPNDSRENQGARAIDNDNVNLDIEVGLGWTVIANYPCVLL